MVEKSRGQTNGNGSAPQRRLRSRFLNWRTLDARSLQGEDELLTYKTHLDDLLKREGEYVLIKGRDIIGIYQDREQAIGEAIDRFGTEPVLVKQIVAREPIHTLGARPSDADSPARHAPAAGPGWAQCRRILPQAQPRCGGAYDERHARHGSDGHGLPHSRI